MKPMARRRNIMNKPMAEYPTARNSKDANLTCNTPHIFHTLREVFAYAHSNGFNSIDVSTVRHRLKETREKQKTTYRTLRDWKAMVIKHERKDWFETNSGVTPVKILQIKRRMGDWIVRIIDTDECGWRYGLSWDMGSWSKPITHRKIKTGKQKKPVTVKSVKNEPAKKFNRFADIEVVTHDN
jgi:hypothetical protein